MAPGGTCSWDAVHPHPGPWSSSHQCPVKLPSAVKTTALRAPLPLGPAHQHSASQELRRRPGPCPRWNAAPDCRSAPVSQQTWPPWSRWPTNSEQKRKPHPSCQEPSVRRGEGWDSCVRRGEGWDSCRRARAEQPPPLARLSSELTGTLGLAAVSKRSGTCGLRRADLACRRKERRAAADTSPSTAGKPGHRSCAWAPPRDAPAHVHTDTHTHARNRDRHGESVGPGPFLSRGTLVSPVPQAGQGPLCWLTGFSCWVTACRSSRQRGPRWGGVTAQVGWGHCPSGDGGHCPGGDGVTAQVGRGHCPGGGRGHCPSGDGVTAQVGWDHCPGGAGSLPRRPRRGR
ncbi:uncharacterized protein [Tursiops truncatus]|uniref:Uncharacterized protein LOC109551515 n=1 Tax=Tursiops truncatus TaxID=9739 RepID=A0A6J3RZ25_TURTR|nr:uncharacterized protein LOC109551515 [Tursiops truncatus]